MEHVVQSNGIRHRYSFRKELIDKLLCRRRIVVSIPEKLLMNRLEQTKFIQGLLLAAGIPVRRSIAWRFCPTHGAIREDDYKDGSSWLVRFTWTYYEVEKIRHRLIIFFSFLSAAILTWILYT